MTDWWDAAADEVGELVKQGKLDVAAPADAVAELDWWEAPDDAVAPNRATPPSPPASLGEDVLETPPAAAPADNVTLSVKVRLAQRKKQRASLGARSNPDSTIRDCLLQRRKDKERSNVAHSPEKGNPPGPADVTILKDIVRRCEQHHGPGALVTGQAWHRLGDATLIAKDRAGALYCYSKATEILQKGAERPALFQASTTAVKFARICCGHGRYSAAAPAFRLALELRRGVLGNSHPSLAEIALELAEVLHEQLGRSEEAALLAAVTLRILRDGKCEDQAIIEAVSQMREEMVTAARVPKPPDKTAPSDAMVAATKEN